MVNFRVYYDYVDWLYVAERKLSFLKRSGPFMNTRMVRLMTEIEQGDKRVL